MPNNQSDPIDIHGISERRFNAFVGWTRGFMANALTTEVAWLEVKPGRVLGTLFVDHTDKEIWSATLAPDLAGRYRGVAVLGPHSDVREAANATAENMVSIHRDYEAQRAQGDEAPPVDFFAKAAEDEERHTRFKYLCDELSAVAARRLIQIMMRWYENQDGTFIQQFQTAAFDARIWELYIWAMLRESGFLVEQPKPAPDFLPHGPHGSFYVEATTANPPPPDKAAPLPTTESEIFDYVHNYLPTRFSGPLGGKLQKRYWDRKGTESIPFVIAVQDFHSELSMTWSQSALYEYLYGVRIERVETAGTTQEVEVPVTDHIWGDKEVPSGFFKLPDSEHISAVVFNAAGTLTKFNRMGISAGMGEGSVAAHHEGSRYSKDNTGEIVEFGQIVEEGYEEDWIDGLTVFHNPNALHSLPSAALPGAAHVFEKDGLRTQTSPAGHLVTSTTKLFTTRA